MWPPAASVTFQQPFPPWGKIALNSGASDQEYAANPPRGAQFPSINYDTQPVLSTTFPYRGGDRDQDVKDDVTLDQRLRSHGAIINKNFDKSSPKPYESEETRQLIGPRSPSLTHEKS